MKDLPCEKCVSVASEENITRFLPLLAETTHLRKLNEEGEAASETLCGIKIVKTTPKVMTK